MNNSSLLADVSGIPYFCFKKMRKYLLSLALVVGVVSMNAQEKVTNNVNMENKKSTLRFIYPQWQGGIGHRSRFKHLCFIGTGEFKNRI
jgi:arginase